MRLHRTLALPIVVLALAARGGGTDDSSTDPVLRTSGVLPSAGGALTVDGASLTLPDAAQPFWVGATTSSSPRPRVAATASA
jgi:hypothetical protein